jgi:selenium-dependent xanthine dehydrogenase
MTMVQLIVNGQKVSAPEGQSLLTFLRETLGLTSVKNGCAQGACGACMVLVDGKAAKACSLRTESLAGKRIMTVEGLSELEKAVFAYAFSEAGAVQCGFCTPGMVISAKALLDRKPDPAAHEIKEVIKNNICRCTGYKKILEAIRIAAPLLRDQAWQLATGPGSGFTGERIPRPDAAAKVLGTAEYVDDLAFEGMLFGGAVRSMTYPRARIKRIDVATVRALPGVAAVLTSADIPGRQKIGHLKKDWDVLIPVGGITHCLGDPVALIAAESREILEKAKQLAVVEYEPLQAIENPKEALAPGAPQLHEGGNILSEEHLVRGHANETIKNSKYVVTEHYSTPFTEHAFMEPETAIAMPDPEIQDGIRIYSADQGIYQTRQECAEMLGLPPEKVRVINKMVGGGFGGKEDMSVQHHAALLAFHTRKPVKVAFSRDESILIHPKRHAMEMDFTTACDENGYLTAIKAVLIADTGAYASLGGPVLQRACTHAAGPYNYQDVYIYGAAVYTNNPPAGAFRGFGVTQSCFAMECNLNRLAAMVGISPWEIRYRNAIRPGQVLPNGQIADETTALAETLEAVKEAFDRNPKAGIACAMKNSGLGVGVPDTGRCRLLVQDGRVRIHSSASCMGQGVGTVLAQIVCQEAGLSLKWVVHEAPDTASAPDAGNSTASRQTLFTGEATRRAAADLREALQTALRIESVKEAGGPLEEQQTEAALSALEGRAFFGEYTGVTDRMGADKPNPVSHIAYSYATHLVELDENGRLKKVLAVHDVGRAINPTNVEAQIDGGVVMSLGYALTEDFPLEHCRPMAKFAQLGLLRSVDVPEIETRLVSRSQGELAFGAKGIGEISAIPTPPAVQLAYYNRDGRFRNQLPLEDTPYVRRGKSR